MKRSRPSTRGPGGGRERRGARAARGSGARSRAGPPPRAGSRRTRRLPVGLLQKRRLARRKRELHVAAGSAAHDVCKRGAEAVRGGDQARPRPHRPQPAGAATAGRPAHRRRSWRYASRRPQMETSARMMVDRQADDSGASAVRRRLRLLSVVAPVYNEAETAVAFYVRVVKALSEVNFELILVDDGSTDGSAEILARLAGADRRVRVISLSRNFGHQAALTAGLDHASGDAVVMLDADLQDPPELIRTMLERWREGVDVVYAVRTERAGESRAKLVDGALVLPIFRAARRRSTWQHNAGDFRLFDRRAARRAQLDAGAQPLPARHERLDRVHADRGALRARSALRRRDEVHASERCSASRFDAISSFSHVPLQLATGLGFVVSLIAFLGIPVAIGLKIAGQFVPGITTVLLAVLLLGGIQLITVGLIGEYLGRVYDEVKGGPSTSSRTAQRTARCGEPTMSASDRPGGDAAQRAAQRVAVIGAGMTGLAAALPAGASGAPPWTSTSAGPGLGGQVATVDVGGARAGGALLPPPVHERPRTSPPSTTSSASADEHRVAPVERRRCSQTGESYPFVSPLDLLRFRPLSLRGRCGSGLGVLRLMRAQGLRARFEDETARDVDRARRWARGLDRRSGARCCAASSEDRADDISMAWLWARITVRRRLGGRESRQELLGYPRGSWQPLLERLRAEIERRGGRVLIDRPAVRTGRGRRRAIEVRSGEPDSWRLGHDPRAFAPRGRAGALRHRRRDGAERRLPRPPRRESAAEASAPTTCSGSRASSTTRRSACSSSSTGRSPPSTGPTSPSRRSRSSGSSSRPNLVDPRALRRPAPRSTSPTTSSRDPLLELEPEELLDAYEPGLRSINPAFSRDWIREPACLPRAGRAARGHGRATATASRRWQTGVAGPAPRQHDADLSRGSRHELQRRARRASRVCRPRPREPGARA